MSNFLRKAIQHPEVYPLFLIVAFAGSMGAFALGRSALRYPDVVWDHKKNPRPWESIKQNEQRTLFSPSGIYNRRGEEIPEIPKF